MKILLPGLIFAIYNMAFLPAYAVTGRYASVAIHADSVLPAQHLRYSPPVEKTAVLSSLAAVGAIVSPFANESTLILPLALVSLVLGIAGLIRIKRSKGRLGGRFLAWFGIAVPIAFIAAIILLLMYAG